MNARIGGVGVSVTQAIMDRFGVSEKSALERENGGVIVNGYKVPVESYYAVVGGGVAGVGSMYAYSMTNVRLAEASISYTIPARMFSNVIQGITLSATGRNLFMFYTRRHLIQRQRPIRVRITKALIISCSRALEAMASAQNFNSDFKKL